jgi:hypothetical protein
MLEESQTLNHETEGQEDPNNEKLSEDLVEILRDLVDHCEKEEAWVRKQQIKIWKKNEEFWHGIQFIFWSETRQDWIPASDAKWFQSEEGREDSEGPFYDYVINIYKAHGESIIAALSAQIPAVRFPPDDADNEDDLTTSKTYSKIADLIQRHNRAKQIFLKALFTLWNQGIVAAYHAPKTDKAFGYHQVPIYNAEIDYCEKCEQSYPDGVSSSSTQDSSSEQELTSPEPEENSSDSSTHVRGLEDEGGSLGESPNKNKCPQCGEEITKRPTITGFKDAPKSRVIIKIFGPLHVKVSYNAKEQNDFGYVGLYQDLPCAYLKSIFPHIKDKIEEDYTDINQYERVARAPSSYSSFSRQDENRHLKTFKQYWLKTWQLENIPEDKAEEKKKLQKMFPNGIYTGWVGRVYAESRDEDQDKYWTFGQCGLSSYFHSDPIGQPLIPIQELRNILVNLTQQTIEQGIPSEFADPDVVNFDEYSRHEVSPGMLYPAKPAPGSRSLGESFYTSPRASLSKEVPGVLNQYDKDGQFAVGSFPSIYGGTMDAKSRTAAEYNMSRQMALQRLSITWSLLTLWWITMIDKCVRLFIENMVEDERFVTKGQVQDGSNSSSNPNNYINVWIRRSEMVGKVGDVEPEGSESFPISIPQKQELLIKLLGMNNEFLNTAIFDPENRKLVADVLAYPEMYIPGEDQRIKQAREIQRMLKGEPVPINPVVDNEEIHIAATKNFLASGIGIDLEKSNPQVYQLIMQHLQMHEQSLAQKTMKQFEAAGPGQPPDRGGPE